MRYKSLIFFIVSLLLVGMSYADEFKPYWHDPSVRESPEIKLYGQYSTNMFPGAATYTYSIDVPKGTNDLTPTVTLFYNSQSVKSRPGILGAGWSLSQNMVYRDINYTPSYSGDDKFVLILDGSTYELVFQNGTYHTEIEYWLKINYSDDYWTVTKPDGTKYRFGYNSDSKLLSNTGKSYSLKWYVDLITDTHYNNIYYSYVQNPYAEDSGAVYLSKIEYNNDKTRTISFSYENSVRPDRRAIYYQGNLLEESRRLEDISITVENNLTKRHHISYVTLNPALSSIEQITSYGSDNTSALYNISLDYYYPTSEYTENDGVYISPYSLSNDEHIDYGTRLEDLNNDGYVDILRSKSGSTYHASINDKSGHWISNDGWISPVTIVDSSGIDRGTRFADINNDGFVDALRSKSGDSTNPIYFNNMNGWTLSSWVMPVSFASSDGSDRGTRITDVNGDGWLDFIRAKEGNRDIFLNNKNGWTYDSSWIFPYDVVDSEGGDKGVRIVDVNGDGLADVLKSEDVGTNTKSAYLNTGAGWYESSEWEPPDYFLKESRADSGMRLFDVNGDGLVDIIKNYRLGSSESEAVWINTGRGWFRDDSWQVPTKFTDGTFSIGRRIVDANGDGLTDIVVSYGDSDYTYIRTPTIPYLLKSITNEYGGVTLINYSQSTIYNHTENGTSGLGFNLYVVSEISKNNSLDNNFNIYSSTAYNYSFGKYDYSKGEFNGFGLTTETDNLSSIKHYFHQDRSRNGKEYSTELYDLEGNLYDKSFKEYNYTYNNGIYTVSLLYSTDYLYDKQSTPSISNKSFYYDNYGNYKNITDWGDIAIAGDEKYYNYSYAINTNDWIINKIAKESVFNSNSDKVKETTYFYDDLGYKNLSNKGELSRIVSWNNNGNDVSKRLTYDAFGNIETEMDNYGHITTYSYDTTHTYVSTIINPLGHITWYNYDLGTGNLLSAKKNDITTSYYYDTFGRITKEVQPYDTQSLPTKSYEYYFDGEAPEKIIVKTRTTANKTADTSYYYDGFGDVTQIKSNLGNGTELVTNILYNNQFKISAQQNPHYATYSDVLTTYNNQINASTYNYDPMGRVILLTNPDGTTKTTSFSKRNISDYDENGHSHKYVLDGLGRIIEVKEYNVDSITNASAEYSTNYEYDGNDNIITITDNLGNKKIFTYDSLGRKTLMSDPDMGVWHYYYDLNSNLIKQTDARGTNITLSYDSLNRITSKNSSDVNISFYYDTQYQGTLSSIIMTDARFNYNYDDRMRIVSETQNISNNLFYTSFVYDSMNRVISQQGFSNIDKIYDLLGKVASIPGYMNASYNPYGKVQNTYYTNGVSTTYYYDPENNRLTRIYASSIQDVSYSYDQAGNINEISDNISNIMYFLSYDSLNRLIRVNAGNDVYKYSYNSIGNIMKITTNDQSSKYVYGGLTHAPSMVISGNSGADIYNPQEIDSGSKNRTFEFFVANDNDDPITGVGVSVDFGNGQTLNINNVNITDNILFLVQTNYSKGGDYNVKFNATSDGSNDYETLPIKFGLHADNITVIKSNTANKTFQIAIRNDLTESITGVSYNCNNGYNSSTFTLGSYQKRTENVSITFTDSGIKNISCIVKSNDGNETASMTMELLGFTIDSYSVLLRNVSQKMIAYTIHNYFWPLNINISLTGEGTYNSAISMSANEDRTIYAELNYSSDYPQNVTIRATSNKGNFTYIDVDTYIGAAILNYRRIPINNSNQAVLFTIKNNWRTGYVNWSVSDPKMSVNTYLSNNDSLMIFIENNYTIQGYEVIEVNATSSKYVNRIRDFAEIRPLKVNSVSTLFENTANALSEVVVQNNFKNNQSISWKFNTGMQNVSSNQQVSVEPTKKLYVYVFSNYSNSDVYTTNIYANSTTYNDSENGVIII